MKLKYTIPDSCLICKHFILSKDFLDNFNLNDTPIIHASVYYCRFHQEYIFSNKNIPSIRGLRASISDVICENGYEREANDT